LPQSIDKNEVLKRIDGVLDYVNESIKNMDQEIERHPYNTTLKNNLISKIGVSLVLKMKQTIEDIAPRKSEYWLYAKSIKIIYSRNMIDQLSEVLKSLKHDYSNNFLNSFNEMIDADIFTDILEQAEYLLSQSYFRASAVVAGVALESHLRKLAEKNQIPITSDDGKYVKADSLNGNLLKSQIIDKTMNKSITGWLGLRNDAAHPDAKQGDEGMIKLMIDGIKLFIEKYPA
jgi:hypothetical protein